MPLARSWTAVALGSPAQEVRSPSGGVPPGSLGPPVRGPAVPAEHGDSERIVGAPPPGGSSADADKASTDKTSRRRYAQLMGVKVKGGMWCNRCQRPVAGQKSTRKLASVLGAVASAGLYVSGPSPFHCPFCGSSVVPIASEHDLKPLGQAAITSDEIDAAVETERELHAQWAQENDVLRESQTAAEARLYERRGLRRFDDGGP